jgi:hypothetical protein
MGIDDECDAVGGTHKVTTPSNKRPTIAYHYEQQTNLLRFGLTRLM